MNPSWPFCVVFGRGTPQFHNLATPLQQRLHVLRNWNRSSCRGLEIPCTAHQVCWEAPEILGNCSCGAVSSVKTMASVQAVLATVSRCKMLFCRFSVFPLQQACQRISVYLHSSFCVFFWIYTLRLNLPIQISSILDCPLCMFSGLRVSSRSVLRA